MKNKFYQIIGQAVTYLSLWALGVYGTYNLMIFILNNCLTTMR